jgi:hypothetical protein
MITNKCTSIAGNFDGHADAWVQCCLYCPIQHVQGYTGSLWTLPLGNYSLGIAPAAARATANKTVMKKCTNFAGHFDGHDDVPVGYRVHRPMEEVQDFGRSYWMPPSGKY